MELTTRIQSKNLLKVQELVKIISLKKSGV